MEPQSHSNASASGRTPTAKYCQATTLAPRDAQPRSLLCSAVCGQIFDMDERGRALCLREADLLLRMQHEHVVQLLDVFLHHNDLFMVMEYADIGDMARLIADMRLKRLRFTEEDMWRFVYCIASGLAHMHAQRMMHRDIKPANIYVSKNGEVKVGDLGLGRVLDVYNDKAASVVGTPYYMSPEVSRLSHANSAARTETSRTSSLSLLLCCVRPGRERGAVQLRHRHLEPRLSRVRDGHAQGAVRGNVSHAQHMDAAHRCAPLRCC